jgi:thiaminase/transcriptional activator TenA
MQPDMSYPSYRRSHENPQFSEWLRSMASASWEELLDHRFVAECTAGSIDPAVYRTYLEQEFAFVETAAVSLGYAVVNAPSLDEIRRFAHALHGLVTDQREYFARAFAEFGVDQWTDPDPLPETRHLGDAVFRGVTSPGYAESLAPIAAAEWLYATWCRRAASEGAVDSRSLVGEWVSLHDDPAFQDHAAWLRDELDRVGPTLSPKRRRGVAYLFGRTVELEVAFHTAPYDATDCRSPASQGDR